MGDSDRTGNRPLNEVRRFRVAGMSDGDCASAIERALNRLPGVETAVVDLDQAEAIIRVSPRVANEQLAQIVEAVGYTLIIPVAIDSEPSLDPEPAFEPAHEPEPALTPDLEPPRGQPAPPSQIAHEELPPNRWKKIIQITGRVALYAFIASIALTVIYRFLPVPGTLLSLGEWLIEGRNIQRNWVSLENMSPHLVRSVIASEDYEFCRHWGFDFKGMEEAWKDAKRGDRLRGASTISQQTAKNVFLWNARSWFRKGLEAYFTVLIETLWPKRRIMEVYLNVIEWGPGVFGADAAARKWFGKPASKLSPLEAARLAAILPNPKRYRANPPGPYVSDRGYTIAARARNINLYGEDRCAKP